MPDPTVPDPTVPTDRDPTRDLRAGLLVSAISIVWTLAASGVAITSGLRVGSLVLVAFGCTGLLDATGSVALVMHFRHSLRHEAFSERHERVAFLIVNTGLVVVAVTTAVESVLRLAGGKHGEGSDLGVATAAASIVVLAVLSRKKIRLGRVIPSPALVADGVLSGTGAILAVVTVIGTLLSVLGWWWADPVAALAVAAGAFSAAVVLAKK